MIIMLYTFIHIESQSNRIESSFYFMWAKEVIYNLIARNRHSGIKNNDDFYKKFKVKCDQSIRINTCIMWNAFVFFTLQPLFDLILTREIKLKQQRSKANQMLFIQKKKIYIFVYCFKSRKSIIIYSHSVIIYTANKFTHAHETSYYE